MHRFSRHFERHVVQWARKYFEGSGHDHTERAERSMVQLHQVVTAHVLYHPPTSGRKVSVRKCDTNPDQEVASGTEALSKGACPARSEQAADGVAGRVERIERQELAGFAELRLKRLQRDARLDAHDHVGLRGLEHAVEPSRVQLDIAARSSPAHTACPA